MSKDYYQILGVKKDASFDDIKKAYRSLAHKYHPDKEGGSEERFKEINEAYYVLSDSKRRSNYDSFGIGPNASFGGRGGPSGAEFFGGFAEGFEDWFSDIFGDLFGAGFATTRREARGRDLSVELVITLKDVLHGISIPVSLTKWAVCDRCKGSGSEPGTSLKTCSACSGAGRLHRVEQTIFGPITRAVPCPTCNGSGEVPEVACTTCRGSGRVKRKDTINVTLPAGLEEGETLLVEGAGDASPKRGGKPGSLYVTVRVAQDKRFRRDGADLWAEEEASFTTLVSGGTVTIKDLDNKSLRLKIPPGTPSGKIFKIAGKGLPKRGGRLRKSFGDLYVAVHVRIPQNPSAKLIDRLKDLEEEL